ncbi:MAG: hypothetical protein VKJ24_19820 [Synechococcales bacterium]|nr:hypothetical protein [Synechococcales bacterium]
MLPTDHQGGWSARGTSAERSIQLAQQTIYRFLLNIVRKWPPEEVLLEFKRLFLYHVDSVNSAAINAVYEIVFSDNEIEFRNTIKRCCYILINNWDATRRYKAIQDLVTAFEEATQSRETVSPTLKQMRNWIERFCRSQDYADLKLFASRYDESPAEEGKWVRRYTSYLLVPQYINLNNPVEQREAARALAQQLRDQFKFDLAMYVARSQSGRQVEKPVKNPTVLGDEVLRLIKLVVAKRGTYSYTNLANIFLNQTKNITFQEFKQCLQKYLVFSVEVKDFAHTLQTKLAEKLADLYAEHHNEVLNDALILRTCNRVIEYLTCENHQEPSPLFGLLLSQGNPLTLVIALLKLILVSRNSRTFLEARIAELIRYYEKFPEEECHWIVNFLEIFNVTFTIYAENVQYNLIRMSDPVLGKSPIADRASYEPLMSGEVPELLNLDAYRIFSQLKHNIQREENTPLELLVGQEEVPHSPGEELMVSEELHKLLPDRWSDSDVVDRPNPT